MEEDILRNLTQRELNELIDKRVEDRIRSRMITQNDIFPQTIKERHIDWEEFGVTLNSSIIQKVTDLVKVTSSVSSSAVIANAAHDEVKVTVSDNTGSATRIVFGIIHSSAYETSVAEANAIPYGSGLAAGDYERSVWFDWGNTNNKNLVLIDYIRNTSGGDQTIAWRFNARYLGQSTA